MYLRKLKQKDAVFMLEWMHDEFVTRDLSTDFSVKSIDDCREFIRTSDVAPDRFHFAIASDSDEYMGTVSLKHIDWETNNAEFAIVVRRSAMGRGYAWFSMLEIINRAFHEYGLNCIYWCVSRSNLRAIHFYDKHNFHEVVDIPVEAADRYDGVRDLKWYSILAGDDYENAVLRRGTIPGCRVVALKTIPTVNAGELSYFEADRDIPFSFKRFYYISKVPEGVKRGFHAHKELKQLLFCPYGKILIRLDNGFANEEIVLSDPSIGIVLERPLWREMVWLKKDSVLCVAASDYYNALDYIREYSEYLDYIR